MEYYSKYFNIVDRNDLYLKVQECPLEELSDSFITEEALREQYTECYYNAATTRLWLDTDKITPLIHKWISRFKEDSYSCTLIPDELKIFSRLPSSNYILQDCTPDGYRIAGQRILNVGRKYEVEAENRVAQAQARAAKLKAQRLAPYTRPDFVQFNDSAELAMAAEGILSDKYSFSPRVPVRAQMMTFIKRNMSWADVYTYLRKRHPKKQQALDIPMIKKIWDNPELFARSNHYRI